MKRLKEYYNSITLTAATRLNEIKTSESNNWIIPRKFLGLAWSRLYLVPCIAIRPITKRQGNVANVINNAGASKFDYCVEVRIPAKGVRKIWP